MFYFKDVLPTYFYFFDQQEFQILFACWVQSSLIGKQSAPGQKVIFNH